MNDFNAHIDGLEELIRKASPATIASPLRKFWTRCAIRVQGLARGNAPVDTGRLRASIAYEIDPEAVPLWAKVGTNMVCAPYMEFGTGTVTDGIGGTGRPHYPPVAALAVWARRHGMNPYAVARAIGNRGGLEPRRYLRQALADSMASIRGYVGVLAREIGVAWNGNY